MRLPAGRVDDRGEVLDLTLHRVGLGVTAVAAAAAPVIHDAEPGGCKVLPQRHVLAPVVEPTPDEDERGPVTAEPVVTDGGAVSGDHMRHGVLLSRPTCGARAAQLTPVPVPRGDPERRRRLPRCTRRTHRLLAPR